MAIDLDKVIPYSCEHYDDVDGDGPYGGAVTLVTRADLGTFALQVNAVSSEPGDTTSVRLTYRNQNGNVTVDTQALNGTTPITLGTAVNRIISLEVISPLAGVFTFSDDLATIELVVIDVDTFSTMRGTRMLFEGAVALDTSVVTRYEKTFWRNHGAGGVLLSPIYRITTDAGAIIEQGIALTLNDSVTITQRTDAPSGITFVDDNIDQSGSDLTSGDAQGIWWKQTAAISNPPQNNFFTSQISFQSI